MGGRRLLIVCLGFSLCVLTGAGNIGFFAYDDYYDLVSKTIPIDRQDLFLNAQNSGFRSSVPLFFLGSIAKFFSACGARDPQLQFRLILMSIAAMVYGFCIFGVHLLFPAKTEYGKKYLTIALALMSFYFAVPILFSRAMIETLSLPFLFLSSVFACLYIRDFRISSLLLSILLLSLASLFRFQSGICVLALLPLVYLSKKKLHWVYFILICILSFVVTGCVDWMVKGEFHITLWRYIQYNLYHSSSHGTSPVYSFVLCFIGLSVPPTFFSSYKDLKWKTAFGPILPVFLYFAVFVGFHSLVPHKEERFMIPVLPLFLVLLSPLFYYLVLENRKFGRLLYFGVVDLALLVLCCWNIPQNNVIELVRVLDRHPEISQLIEVGGGLILFPDVLMNHPIERRPLPEEWESTLFKCSQAFVVKPEVRKSLGNFEKFFTLYAEFQPGIIERLVINLNPKRNSRRGKLELWGPHHCPFNY